MQTSFSGFTFTLLLVTGALLSGSHGTAGETQELDTKLGSGHNQPSNSRPQKPIGTPSESDFTSQGRLNFFDGELLQKLAGQEEGNFVVSPASIKTLLGLILEGAEDTTLQELLGVLRLPNDINQARELMRSLQTALQRTRSPHVNVDSATQAYISKDLQFNTSYARAILDLYKAGTDSLNFKDPENAAARINSWVNTETRGNIPTLISADKIDPDTLTILVNTVFFDAKWKDEFQDKDVNKECFYSAPNLECRMVDMMYKKADLLYRYHNDFNSHVVQLPYKDERFSMVLVVPEKRNGIKRLLKDLNHLVFPGLLDKARPNEVHLKLPKFTVEYNADLKNILTQMGLNTVFSDEAKLPYMINKKQGQVSSMIHKAKIEVTEKGTKASAASGAVVVPLMSGNDAAYVIADHPFYYFIYDGKTKNVLFAGRISSLDGEIGIGENNPPPPSVYPLRGNKNEPESSHQELGQGDSSHSRPHPSTPKPPHGSGVVHQGISNSEYGKGTQHKSGQGSGSTGDIDFPSEPEPSLKPGIPDSHRNLAPTESPGFLKRIFG